MILLGSILAGIYVWKVVEIVYFKPVVDSSAEITEAPWSLVLPAWTLIGASLYFGVDASLSSSLAQRAARLLLAQSYAVARCLWRWSYSFRSWVPFASLCSGAGRSIVTASAS